MLRKKLIALGLVGITTLGTIAGNTVIAIAAPTKAEASHKLGVSRGITMLKAKVNHEMNHLEKFIKEGKYQSAINLQNPLKDQLKLLSDLGQDTTDLQNKFDKLLKQSKSKQIELLERRINNSIEIILSLLNDREYKKSRDEFETLYKYMEKLSEYKPIDKTLLNNVGKLEYRYKYRSEMVEIASMLSESINFQLDELSKVIKEKNINESISIRKKIESDIKKLTEFSKVSDLIHYRFNQSSEKLDKLINSSEAR